MMTTKELKNEVSDWSDKIGVKPVEVHVRQMRRKWASCSSKGRITLNAEMLVKPRAFRSEVIVHELLHLKYPNHGKMFKALLRTYLGRTIKS